MSGTPTAFRCEDCSTQSPRESSAIRARAAAKAVGWQRSYRNRIESWRCPKCRTASISKEAVGASDGVNIRVPFVLFDRLVAQARAEGRGLVEHIDELSQPSA